MNREELLKIAKPILFNTDMVRAIMREENPKTVTRRILEGFERKKTIMSVKWIEEKEPFKAELIQEVTLTSGNGVIASAGKDNPVPGVVTHHGYRIFGKNRVLMYKFSPDVMPDKSWNFSSKYFKRIKSE